MKVEYINGLGDIYTFFKQKDGNVLMIGKFKSLSQCNDWINPPGGPMIKKGQMLSHLLKDTEFNVIIEGFIPVEGGYLIKTRPNEVDSNDFTHLDERDIIGGII